MPSAWTGDRIDALLSRPIEPIATSWLYRAGLAGLAASLVILQAIYLAMVAGAAYLTYAYLIRLPAILVTLRIGYLSILAFAPLVAGVIVTFFLLKPLLARPAAPPEFLELDPAAEPAIFAFVQRLCWALGAPMPSCIEIDLRVNASARLRRGWRSMFTNDLALTIGLPLAAGLTVRQFTGVLAHEFGHFSQQAGMRMYFLTFSIRRWFARVAFERDQWDARLEQWGENEGWRTRSIVWVASITVEASRWILRGLLQIANILSAWFSRQMEFDADRHEAAVVGTETFKETMLRLPVLEHCSRHAWSIVGRSSHGQRLCDDFPALVTNRDSVLAEDLRTELAASHLAETAERWATHPAPSARIDSTAAIQGLLTPGIAESESAAALFVDFAGLCRRATLGHYELELPAQMGSMKLVPIAEFLLETSAQARRAEATQSMFGPANQPSRWFRLPDGPLASDTIHLVMTDKDETEEYWRLLNESLNRHAALEFVRAGGRVKPEAFQLMSSEPETVEAQAAASRKDLDEEIARLRNMFADVGHLLKEPDDALVAAYRALSAEQETLLELRHAWLALEIVSNNIQMLAAASAANALEKQTARITSACDAIVARLRPLPPVTVIEAEGATGLAAQLLLKGASELSPQELALRVLNRADVLAVELLGELCARVSADKQD